MFQENKAGQIFRKTKGAYQGARNFSFSENLLRFVFLKHPFWDSLFCLITDDVWSWSFWTVYSFINIESVCFADNELYFSVSLQFGACYITGRWDKFKVKETTLCSHKLFTIFCCFSSEKLCFYHYHLFFLLMKY